MHCHKYVEREGRQCSKPVSWLIKPDADTEIYCCQAHAWYYRDLFGAPRMRKMTAFGLVTLVEDGNDKTPNLPPVFHRRWRKQWAFSGNLTLGRFL